MPLDCDHSPISGHERKLGPYGLLRSLRPRHAGSYPRTAFVIILIGNAGCAEHGIFGGGTGVLPVGPDTYTITENAILSAGGSVAAQQRATRTATEYCTNQGRQFLTINYQTIPKGGSDSFSLVFRCLLPNDPELRRPTLQPMPNVLIENRAR